MTHAHVAGWRRCPVCGIAATLDCPQCAATHARLHHAKRRRRMKKVEENR